MDTLRTILQRELGKSSKTKVLGSMTRLFGNVGYFKLRDFINPPPRYPSIAVVQDISEERKTAVILFADGVQRGENVWHRYGHDVLNRDHSDAKEYGDVYLALHSARGNELCMAMLSGVEYIVATLSSPGWGGEQRLSIFVDLEPALHL